MTTVDEQYMAMHNTRSFLYRLINPKSTPKVPKKIREEARAILKHFPNASCLNGIERRENFLRTLRTEMENMVP